MPAVGRPSSYTDDLADEICLRLSQGESLIKICEGDGMPSQPTVFLWLQKHSEFSKKYREAREAQADYLAEEVVVIADETGDPAKARLQIDARKWFASKVAPKKYGDKVTQEIQGKEGGPILFQEVRRIIVDTQHSNPESVQTPTE